ncbi:MAG: DUF4058 family protein [Caldilinea sp.]
MEPLGSPFPGMDPYLESPHEWSTVHSLLLGHMLEALAARVPSQHLVRIEQRVYIAAPGSPDRTAIEPAVLVAREQRTAYAAGASTITPPALLAGDDLAPEIHDRFIEIRDSRSHEVITTIELLSPFNKRPGAQGYAAFQQKRAAVMASPTHWLEIDLLRAGERPPTVTHRSDYYALLKRGGASGYEVWWFDLRETMPVVAVPLRSPDADVALDLQAILGEMYRRVRFADQIDYSQPPPPPALSAEDERWAAARIETWQSTRARL